MRQRFQKLDGCDCGGLASCCTCGYFLFRWSSELARPALRPKPVLAPGLWSKRWSLFAKSSAWLRKRQIWKCWKFVGWIGGRHDVGDAGVGGRCHHCSPNLAIFCRQIKKKKKDVQCARQDMFLMHRTDNMESSEGKAAVIRWLGPWSD